MYVSGAGRSTFKDAFEGFQSMEADRSDNQLQYRLGQILRDGVGTEPAAEQALLYFEAGFALLPGSVKPDMSMRGGYDYRLDAISFISSLTSGQESR